MERRWVIASLSALALFIHADAHSSSAQKPAPATDLEGRDHWLDGGDQIDLSWKLSADDSKEKPLRYKILRASEKVGHYKQLDALQPNDENYDSGNMEYTVEKCEPGEEYFFHVVVITADGTESDVAEVGPVKSKGQPFAGHRFWLAVIIIVLSGAVIYWILQARSGRKLNIRKIPGLEAVEEAVGRATEMGRSCVFVPGIQDMKDIQTIAGLTILSRVAETAARYDAKVEVPTTRSLVMTAARETVQSAFLSAGRPERYNEDLIYYVTDEQFGYVAYMAGMMVREKPAACFYMGAFFAESLILAETGNSIGAIQVAGTAAPTQLPFFVAACDYTLIGEEFFAASAYLSGDPKQLGSLKGQDVGKIIIGVLIVIGCGIATLASLTGSPAIESALEFLTETVLG